MNNLSLRPGPWIKYTNIQVTTLLSDYKTFSQQLTLLSDPNKSTQYVKILIEEFCHCRL